MGYMLHFLPQDWTLQTVLGTRNYFHDPDLELLISDPDPTSFNFQRLKYHHHIIKLLNTHWVPTYSTVNFTLR